MIMNNDVCMEKISYPPGWSNYRIKTGIQGNILVEK